MPTLHVISHTHWDREWYLTFQQFRFRLVQLMEELLRVLQDEPGYLHFMLDGQTIVLEDVLDVRPDLEPLLRQHVRAGRILIGPWYLLPDEFLVSPEALLRNLLRGGCICRDWGGGMALGYVPDPFGHISQLPQLLRGLGIDTALFSRGPGDAPVEFRWAAADGSEVLVCYLRDHYGNVANLPADAAGVVQALAQARDSLAAHSASTHLLMMEGSDHVFPRADLPALLAAAAAQLPDRVVHSSLPRYVAAVRAELGADGLARLPLLRGELRDPRRVHLLPNVLSTRMWIKQRNHACQTLLEQWAEPFELFGQGDKETRRQGEKEIEVTRSPSHLVSLSPFTQRAWRYLLENHPHDSICGCSVDQVHREMVTRFDQCEQIGLEVRAAALEALARQVDTAGESLPALVVLNPSSTVRSDVVLARVVPPVDPQEAVLLDPAGQSLPYRVVRHSFRSEMEMTFDRATMRQMIDQAQAGGVVWGEWRIHGFQAWPAQGETARVAVSVSRAAGAAPVSPIGAGGLFEALLADERVQHYRVRIREDEALEIAFVARDLPPLGYATYRLQPAGYWPLAADGPSPSAILNSAASHQQPAIQNEFFRLEADPQTGALTLLDRETGWRLPDFHGLVDEGDRGDLYNYCRPEHDERVAAPLAPPQIERQADAVGESLLLNMVYSVPRALDATERTRRSIERVELPLTVRVTLTPGVRRVDFETTVDNCAADHRLRAHLRAPLHADAACAEGHWDVVEWPLALPAGDVDWAEQPAPVHPQRGWASLSDGAHGLTVANRGLPEVEVLATEQGSEIALTLLRCVEWLSRDDLAGRRGHAGPPLQTPEAQCPGRHMFRYAALPHAGDWRAAFAAADEFQTDLQAVSAAPHAGPLPLSRSFVRVEPPALRVSALKRADESAGWILRLWNVDDRPVTGTVRLWRPFARIARCNMAERDEEELARDVDALALTLRGREVLTLHVYEETEG